MTTVDNPVELDEEKLQQFLFQAVGDVGATLNTALVVMGDRLGLYRAMAGAGGVTPGELAQRSGVSERYVREWLNGQAAGGYVQYEPADGTYSLSPEQHAALAAPDSPAYLPGVYQSAMATLHDAGRVIEAIRTGAGFGWHEHHPDLFEGTERFFRTGYQANLVPAWLPALDGVVAKLEAGARVADIGCGHGASTILMAQAFPNSTFVGTDYHVESIDTAKRRAAAAGVGDRARFEAVPATANIGNGFDLVTMFDCLHDMGDPSSAARRVRDLLAADGTWMIVEPAAGDRVEENLNPVGRLFYGFSTFVCTPSALSQEPGVALGAQAGEARLRDIVTSAGFSRFRRATETPFNIVLEARP